MDEEEEEEETEEDEDDENYLSDSSAGNEDQDLLGAVGEAPKKSKIKSSLFSNANDEDEDEHYLSDTGIVRYCLTACLGEKKMLC